MAANAPRLAAVPVSHNFLFNLFEDEPAAAPRGPAVNASQDTPDKRYRKAIRLLLAVRQELGDQLEGSVQISDCITAIRAERRATDDQRRDRILFSIETQGATTPTEIAEDTRLPIQTVNELIEEMITDGRIYRVKKYVPGSDRQWYMLKSARAKMPEAADSLLTPTKSIGELAVDEDYESDYMTPDE